MFDSNVATTSHEISSRPKIGFVVEILGRQIRKFLSIAIPIVVRYRVLGFEESGVRSQDSGFRIQESGFGIQELRFWCTS